METTNSWHKPGLLPLCEGPKAPAGILKSSFSKSQDISSSQIQLPSVFQLSTWWTLKNGPKCKGVSRSLRVKGSVEVLREGLSQPPHLAVTNTKSPSENIHSRSQSNSRNSEILIPETFLMDITSSWIKDMAIMTLLGGKKNNKT